MKNSIIFFFTITMLGCFNVYAQSENYAKFYNKGNKLLDNTSEAASYYFTRPRYACMSYFNCFFKR